MSKQNIFDDETFFDSYKELRERTNSNDLIEKPALFSLLPNLDGKAVVDLGCGFGEHCKEYVRLGAKVVCGIDISSKMLEVARNVNADEKIIYREMAIENINDLDMKFDLVVSSLAFHYVKDFDKVTKEIYKLLNDDGYLIFSQEHPFSTSFSSGERWTRNEKGEVLFANISNYSCDGPRESSWFIDNISKYHRTFSSIINTLVKNGFVIETFVEPIADETIIHDYPRFKDLIHKPDFLIIKAKK